MKTAVSILTGLTWVSLATMAPAAYDLVNGDFSGGLTGWTVGGSGDPVTVVDGVAVLPINRNLRQDFSGGTTVATAENYNFQLDFSFAVSALTDLHRIQIRDHNNAGDIMTLRFRGDGAAIQASNLGTFVDAVTGITIATDTFYWVRVIGLDFDLASRSYTVGFSTDGDTYLTGAPMTAFSASFAGRDFETILFFSGGTAGNTLKIDNVSVAAIPEPSAAALGALGLLALLRLRRKA